MSKKRKKKQVLSNIKILSYAAEGNSIATIEEGKVLFVENTVPGDIVDVVIIKDKTNWARGKMLKLVQPSELRITPFCKHFGLCGGCKWQMLPYNLQLIYKQQQVADQLSRIGNVELPEINNIIGSANDRLYRNKLEFTFSTRRFRTFEEIAVAEETFSLEPVLGFHAPGLFDKVVEIETCHLMNEPTNKILKVLREYTKLHNLPYYDFKERTGWLRGILLRIATTGEILLNVVLHYEMEQEREDLLKHIINSVPEITSLNYTINKKLNDTIYDQDVICWYGKKYIEEKLENFIFKISPKSFFQTNTMQAENLYKVTRNFAGLTGTETLYDLYCGTGSIGIFCSAMAKQVIGIETVEDAITDAKENALINNITNCKFFAGDVIDICTDDFFKKHGKPDVIITDPPRVGMHTKLIEQLLKIKAPKIVYVSCNPATQARDLQLLDSAYKITALQPVDMFPHTHHIENVALLVLREG